MLKVKASFCFVWCCYYWLHHRKPGEPILLPGHGPGHPSLGVPTSTGTEPDGGPDAHPEVPTSATCDSVDHLKGSTAPFLELCSRRAAAAIYLLLIHQMLTSVISHVLRILWIIIKSQRPDISLVASVLSRGTFVINGADCTNLS